MSSVISRALQQTLQALERVDPRGIHRLEIELAELVIPHAPPGAPAQLELGRALIEGRGSLSALREARQECWAYAGSLACGCSTADSASSQAMLVCLDPDPTAHHGQSLIEQTERVLRCGVSEERVLAVLLAARSKRDAEV